MTHSFTYQKTGKKLTDTSTRNMFTVSLSARERSRNISAAENDIISKHGYDTGQYTTSLVIGSVHTDNNQFKNVEFQVQQEYELKSGTHKLWG